MRPTVRRTAAGVVLGSLIASGCVFGDDPVSLDDLMPLQVAVTEIHYSDPADNPDNAFIELHNSGEKKVSIGGWCIDGVDFCFEKGTVLAPGQFLATPVSALGSGLSGAGEKLVLRDPEGSVRDEVEYSDRTPWPDSADGVGDSLQRLLPARTGSDPGSWFAAPPTPNLAGDPASRLAPVIDPGLAISEIHYHDATDDPTKTFIEFVNASSAPVSPSGWCLAESGHCLSGEPVPAGGFIVIDDRTATAALGSGGGTLTLLRPDNSVAEIVRWDNRGHWPSLADGFGHSLQRRDVRLRAVEPGNWGSAEPTRGEGNTVTGTGMLPLVVTSTHTVSPAAGVDIPVTASLRDADSATLLWRTGFTKEKSLPMSVTDGVASATIPGQKAGTLVRYRVVATNTNGDGTWPRQGAGPRWDGTVVASPAETPLPVLQWFMTDEDFIEASRDRELGGDEGYPAVFAWKGEIMDNATVRIKGQQSRGNTKKKWKVALAAGDLWESPDLASPVNEFALHSATTDKSFVREILTSDVQEVGGGMRQQIFPLRLEKNGEFWGLYIYQEQTDGRWRAKYGFSERAIVFKGEKTSTARLAHLNMPVEEFNRRYNRTTQDWTESRDEMRDLIRTVNDPNEQRLIRFAYEHIDIPQVVETLAVMKVAQHIELEHKNHVYVLDPEDGRWRFIAIDHDLNFGRRWRGACQSFCEDVEASTYMNYMQSNMFTRIFIEIPQFRRMLDRRTKTIADAFLAEGVPEKRIAELARLMTADAALDRRKWGSYGERQSMEQAQRILVSRYIEGRRAQFVTGTRILPASQTADAEKMLKVDATTLTVTNTGKTTVDLSGMELAGLPARIPAGVVLNAGQSVTFETSRIPDAGRPKNSGLLRVWLPGVPAR